MNIANAKRSEGKMKTEEHPKRGKEGIDIIHTTVVKLGKTKQNRGNKTDEWVIVEFRNLSISSVMILNKSRLMEKVYFFFFIINKKKTLNFHTWEAVAISIGDIFVKK